jgi:4'-phosphopantetheinyl transferase
VIKLFAAPATTEYSKFFFDRVYPFISPQKKHRIDSFFYTQDALRTLAGDWLARYSASLKFGSDFFAADMTCDENNKPGFSLLPDFHFNISHSGAWAVCAVSRNPVGADIEVVLPIDTSIAEDFFTDNELKTLTRLTKKSDKLDYFYEIWTIKESYLKATGSGLFKPPASFGIILNNGVVTAEGDIEEGYNFKRYSFNSEYKLSVCGYEGIFCKHVTTLIPGYIL